MLHALLRLYSPWMHTQFTVASTVYYAASTLYPAKETFIPRAILPDNVAGYADEMGSEDLEKASLDKAGADVEVKSTLSKHDL